MNPYNKDAFCIKCGGTDIISVYHEESDGNDDSMVLVGIGWINIEIVRTDGVNIVIDVERYPLFSD